MTNDEVIKFVNRRGVRLSLELCGTWRWMPFRCHKHIQDMSLGYQVMQEGIAFLCFRVMFRRTRYYVPAAITINGSSSRTELVVYWQTPESLDSIR